MPMPDPMMPPNDAALEALMAAAADLSGLVTEPEWKPAVLASLKATALAARQVLDCPLSDEIEPAPVFAP